MKESNIQTSIKNQLTKHGWYVIKLIQTSINGIPDLLALRNSQSVFIEVKQPGNNPTPLQAIRHKQLREQGFEVVIANSIKDTIHLCN